MSEDVKMAGEKKKKQTGRKKEVSAEPEASNELNEPRWAVISFERCEAKNLTYSEAERKLNQLLTENVSGLCIVTNEVAERISKN